jgi:hypothetical protein
MGRHEGRIAPLDCGCNQPGRTEIALKPVIATIPFV